MLLGPVFRAELLRTARRRRYYAIRVAYGALLLAVVWLGYLEKFSGQSRATIDEAADYALATFIGFAIVQLTTILLMIPALFGGSIADEKQRKTLHYLMASQLSSFEIVVDKFLGRAPHVATFVALGLPIVCLLGLIGGLSPDYVVVAYVGTISTATTAAALTVLVSTVSRKVRQAVLVSYVLLLAWQFAPTVILLAGSRLYRVTYSWVEPANTWIGSTSPLWVWVSWSLRSGFSNKASRASSAILVELMAWMVGLQLAAAAAMVLLAVWRLRPAFRRHEATQPRRKWFGERRAARARPRRWWDRPPCGEDAMLWKERYFARTDIFTKLVVLPATVFASTILILSTGLDESLVRSVVGLWQGHGSNAEYLVDHLRVVTAWYVAIWLLALAGSSASCLTVEREEDTWVSLTSTPLTGLEIIRGKVLGAAWSQRGFLAIPVGLWSLGLIVGAVHPLAFLGALVALALASWLVVAVGVYASLMASSTSKALGRAIGTLAVLYGYPLFVLRSFHERGVWDDYEAFVGLPARVAVGPLATWGEVANLHFRPIQVVGLALSAIYLLVAALLTNRAVAQFDRRLDRPSLTRATEARPAPPKPIAAEPAFS